MLPYVVLPSLQADVYRTPSALCRHYRLSLYHLHRGIIMKGAYRNVQKHPVRPLRAGVRYEFTIV